MPTALHLRVIGGSIQVAFVGPIIVAVLCLLVSSLFGEPLGAGGADGKVNAQLELPPLRADNIAVVEDWMVPIRLLVEEA